MHAARRDIGQRLADKPVLVVLACAGDLVFGDLSQCAIFVADVVPCWENLNVNDWEDAVVHIMVMDVPSDLLLADVMHCAVHLLVCYSYESNVRC